MVSKIIVNDCPICGSKPTTYYQGPMFNADIGLECKKCQIKAKARNMYWLAVEEEWNKENFIFGQMELEL